MTSQGILAAGLLCTVAFSALASLAQPDHAVQFIAFGTLIGFVVTAAIVAVVWWLNRAGSDRL